jgi:hypothetical protein
VAKAFSIHSFVFPSCSSNTASQTQPKEHHLQDNLGNMSIGPVKLICLGLTYTDELAISLGGVLQRLSTNSTCSAVLPQGHLADPLNEVHVFTCPTSWACLQLLSTKSTCFTCYTNSELSLLAHKRHPGNSRDPSQTGYLKSDI